MGSPRGKKMGILIRWRLVLENCLRTISQGKELQVLDAKRMSFSRVQLRNVYVCTYSFLGCDGVLKRDLTEFKVFSGSLTPFQVNSRRGGTVSKRFCERCSNPLLEPEHVGDAMVLLYACQTRSQYTGGFYSIIGGKKRCRLALRLALKKYTVTLRPIRFVFIK